MKKSAERKKKLPRKENKKGESEMTHFFKWVC